MYNMYLSSYKLSKKTQLLYQKTQQQDDQLGPSGRNNGSQAHEINKWVLRKQMGLEESGEREVANLWAVCDVEK